MSLQEVSHPANNLHRVTLPEGRNYSQAVAFCCRDHRLISACRPVHKSRTSPCLELEWNLHAPADCLIAIKASSSSLVNSARCFWRNCGECSPHIWRSISIDVSKRRVRHVAWRASADTQASFADAVNVAAFFLTNSCTLSGPCPVSVSTSSDIRS